MKREFITVKKIRYVAAIVLVLMLLQSGCAGNKTTPSETSPVTTVLTVSPEATSTLPVITASQIADGTYAIEVQSSSSMFRIVACALTVDGDHMTAVMTLGGTGYEKLFMGTGQEALDAQDDEFSYFVENAEGAYTYEVPVTALNEGIDCAAFSIRKQSWYDRVLVFESTAIPASALAP